MHETYIHILFFLIFIIVCTLIIIMSVMIWYVSGDSSNSSNNSSDDQSKELSSNANLDKFASIKNFVLIGELTSKVTLPTSSKNGTTLKIENRSNVDHNILPSGKNKIQAEDNSLSNLTISPGIIVVLKKISGKWNLLSSESTQNN